MTTTDLIKTISPYNQTTYSKALHTLPARALEQITEDAVNALKRLDDAGLDRPDYISQLAKKYLDEITTTHEVSDLPQLQRDIAAICDFAFDRVKASLTAYVDEFITSKEVAE